MLPKYYKRNYVKQSEMQDVANRIWKLQFNEAEFGFDTETYGTKHDDRMFALIISTEEEGWYFNMYEGDDHQGNKADTVVSYTSLTLLDPVFNQESAWYSHNAKFDLTKMRMEGVSLPHKVRCTYATERLVRNDRIYYSLEEVAKNYGYQKDMSVDEYIKEHGLYERRYFAGKEFDKIPQFYKVPYTILTEYAFNDAYLHLMVGKKQRERLFQVV